MKTIIHLLTLCVFAHSTTACIASDADPDSEHEASQTSALTAFEADAFTKHNVERRKHNTTTDLTWSPNLALGAQIWANECTLQHSDKPYGENIYAGPSTAGAIMAANFWLAEGNDYNYSSTNPVNDPHFTQMVWAGTTYVGCAETICGNGTQKYIVCRYHPAGNGPGTFVTNVKTCKYGRTGGTTGACNAAP